MPDTTKWGFPKGRVAQTLRGILDPSLAEHEVEAIVVCLMAHLLVENRLNEVLYRWLMRDAPRPTDADAALKSEKTLWANVVALDFAKKYSLVHPFFAPHFPDEARDAWKINDLRNTIFHGRAAVRDAEFHGQPLSQEDTVEKVFIAAQLFSMQLDKFDEFMEGPHVQAQRWGARLRELGEPLG